MRTFTQVLISSWCIGALVLIILAEICPAAAVQVVFFDEKNYEGNSLTLSLTGGCYKFKKKWTGKASSVQVERDGCIVAWKNGDCTGQSIKVLAHSHDSNDLQVFGFDNRIKSVSLCAEISYRPIVNDDEVSDRMGSSKELLGGSVRQQAEVNFYDEPDFGGNIFTLTLYASGDCYNFKTKWANKIASLEAQGSCLKVWDTFNCEGSYFNLNPSNTSPEEYRNLKRIKLDNRIKSIRLCSQPSSSSSSSPSTSSSSLSTFPSTDSDDFSGGSIENSGKYRSTENARKEEPATPSIPPKGNDDTSLDQEIMEVAVHEHNKYRSMHGVNDLQWDSSLQNTAQSYATYLAKNNKFQHSKGHYDLGENLAGTTTANKVDALKEAIHLWYNEIHHYDFKDPSHSVTGIQAGHFTQIVWKGTTNFGLGMAWNPRRSWWVVVANYSPAGNFKGEYKTNVFPPVNS